LKIYYNPKLKKRAQELRRNATFSEQYLWKYLKQKQLGFQFTRQKPIGNYIVDFYCPRLNLVIEIDGETHNGKEIYDKKRENDLHKIGLYILRFDGHYLLKNTESVLKTINNTMKTLQ
jgi:very-short-patch-repair endonuclease